MDPFFLLKSFNEGIFFRSGLSYSDHSMRVFVSERVELLRSLNEGIFFSERVELLRSLNKGIFSERVELLNEGMFFGAD